MEHKIMSINTQLDLDTEIQVIRSNLDHIRSVVNSVRQDILRRNPNAFANLNTDATVRNISAK